jgi:hypothetical protein
MEVGGAERLFRSATTPSFLWRAPFKKRVFANRCGLPTDTIVSSLFPFLPSHFVVIAFADKLFFGVLKKDHIERNARSSPMDFRGAAQEGAAKRFLRRGVGIFVGRIAENSHCCSIRVKISSERLTK